jgi:hypothetical protein
MAASGHGRSVASLLDQVKEMHIAEVDALKTSMEGLRSEVARLRADGIAEPQQLPQQKAQGDLRKAACQDKVTVVSLDGGEESPHEQQLDVLFSGLWMPNGDTVEAPAGESSAVCETKRCGQTKKCSVPVLPDKAVVEQLTPTSSREDESPSVRHVSEPSLYVTDNLSKLKSNTSKKLFFELGENNIDVVQESLSLRSIAKKIVKHPGFDLFFFAVIIASAIIMSFQAQYDGFNVAQELVHDSARLSAEKMWPGGGTTFLLFDWAFGVLFTLELVLRLAGTSPITMLFSDGWFYVDFVIVLTWILQKIGTTLPVNPQLIRLARVARLLRLLRLAKKMQALDSLFVLMTALKGSIMSLSWSAALLTLMLTMLALLINQIMTEYYFYDDSRTLEERREVFTYFGTFSRSLFSMFELTLANWPQIGWVLSENVSEWFMIFVIIHKLVIGVAVIGVINSLFMQETLSVAALDDVVMLRQRTRAIDNYKKKMCKMFNQADISGDGRISKLELADIVSVQSVKVWLSAMDIHIWDVNEFFDLADTEQTGAIDADQFIEQVARLKGPARSVDLRALMRDFKVQMADHNEHLLRELMQGDLRK